jgi:hypothetical protein
MPTGCSHETELGNVFHDGTSVQLATRDIQVHYEREGNYP